MSIIPAQPHKTLEIRRFTRESAPDDFEKAWQLRLEVFVKEQHVPIELEQDKADDEAQHWLLLENDLPVATGRFIAYQEGCQMRPVAKIGRIAVKKEARGNHLGERMMQEILRYVQAEDYDQAILDAQTPVVPFYEKLGFRAEGDEFEDAGIMHYRMRLILNE